ncbi:hypothetical protein CCR75_009653 [Bremia lactucae]|uniref:Uncharacterized protein n=1 Tax=Bremia lactucae TaxID=4779 RepID=A0A976FJH4_BRELC|nr:hypothetical protein CCR75_009653 [Bremia lactucae]
MTRVQSMRQAVSFQQRQRHVERIVAVSRCELMTRHERQDVDVYSSIALDVKLLTDAGVSYLHVSTSVGPDYCQFAQKVTVPRFKNEKG